MMEIDDVDELDSDMVHAMEEPLAQNGRIEMDSPSAQYDSPTLVQGAPETPEDGFDGGDEDDDVDNLFGGQEFTPSVSSSPSPGDDSLPPRKPWKPTGCCYDDRMKLHANADFSDKPTHPEDPRRIERIMMAFKEAGLIYSGSNFELEKVLMANPTSWMYRISARAATKAEICTVHTATHFQWVEDLSSKTSAELRYMTKEMDQGRKSLYVGNLTYEAALISAGGAIETCKNVVEGTVKNAIAVIRPPGHHAEYNESMGFCLFNNVSIAAEVCKQDYPETCRKILILDWDVHHGNGVQNIFYEDPNVLYISIHIYQDGMFYPAMPDLEGVPDGKADKCGRGKGEGRNVNIGWSDNGMGDGEYMAAFQRIVMPIAQEFDPDLVIVAAGFDAAAGDELGGCYVTPECYAHMTHMLMSLADGKLAVCLEGGYDLRAISRSALAVAKTLMGEPPPRMTRVPPINIEASKVLDEVRDYQAPYWDCMRRTDTVVIPKQVIQDVRDLKPTRLGDVVRGYQRKMLSTNHRMIPLYVLRDKISQKFEDQVLVTQGIMSAKKILFIIHDPPELLAIPDPIDNIPTIHNSWIEDGVMPYIDWAIANGFGVLDLNMPMTSNPDHDPESITVRASEAELQATLNEIVCYLWDNYLEVCDASHIVLMGVGYSYLGVKNLLTSRESRRRISAILNFVTGSLRPVRTETDPKLSHWYKDHSRVYVASDHLCWSDEEYARKVRKNRFGTVVESSEAGLNRMLSKHLEESTQWVEEIVGGDAKMAESGLTTDLQVPRTFGGILPGK